MLVAQICPKKIRSLVSGGALFSFWALSFVETQFFGDAINAVSEVC